ncbi:type II secretion system protein [Lentisphaera profundi]|uniref:Type II secretion system protein n=1 Tax=Lentisphaera profundi TaxID=1658616 RepID=A0ABY7VRA5_9BACT|nr:type II secretion system protein [Lentisphaera profundi]WDE95753.1 type II secretion system protein [Lentisphaera profundi]
MKQKKTFTLIEVLLVFAIIGILASLLIPTLRKARDTSRAALCVSNMKQMFYGAFMYTEDNGNYYPATTFPKAGVYNRSIHDGIATYVMDVSSTGHNPALSQSYSEGGIFSCPSFDESELTARGVSATATRSGYSGYGSNPSIHNDLSKPLYNGAARKITRMNSSMITHAEGKSVGILNSAYAQYWVYPWHKDKSSANYTYADGHVQASSINHLLLTTDEPWNLD